MYGDQQVQQAVVLGPKRSSEGGFVSNDNYPEDISSETDSAKRSYVLAWNMAYQYFNLLHRVINPAVRKVFWSGELESKKATLPLAQMRAIEAISLASEAGESLLPHMSYQIRRADFEDYLYSDWKIVHLHLDTIPSVKPHLQTKLVHFVERTGPVLFGYVTENGLYLIDILEHGSWAERELFEILHKNWPGVIEPYRLKGLPGTGTWILSSEEILRLRKAGIHINLEMSDGSLYRPLGGGLATSGANAQIVTHADDLFRRSQSVLDSIQRNIDQVVPKLEEKLGKKMDTLELIFALSDGLLPLFYEKSGNIPIYIEGLHFNTHNKSHKSHIED
jgi:hypothetical protein